MKERNCYFCDKPIPEGAKLGTRFCSDKCKDDHFNALRKMERAEKRALEAIATLRQEMTKSRYLGSLTRDYLEQIQESAYSAKNGITYECVNCGQRTFEPPTHGTKCAFCGKFEFKMITKGNRNDS